MGRLMIVGWFCVGLAWLAMAQHPEDCGPCDRSKCEVNPPCPAGPTIDHCGCCTVCAKQEFELCDHRDVPSATHQGKCGENLECRVRDDLEHGDPAEAICFCMTSDTVCGTNGKTYENLCQMSAAAIREGITIDKRGDGPCQAAPVIVGKPENAKDLVGQGVALVCEATGYPIPAIEWTWTRVDGKTEMLPSDDLQVSVYMRGGPEKWQVTGWLQIMEMEKKHEGDYTCLAQNMHGMDKATARVNIIEEDDKDAQRRYKNGKY